MIGALSQVTAAADRPRPSPARPCASTRRSSPRPPPPRPCCSTAASPSASAPARRSTSTSSATAWPSADVRLEMLEEAVEVIRLLWTGGVKDHDGTYYTVENARIYTLPGQPGPDLRLRLRRRRRADSGRAGSATASAAPSPTPSWSAPSATPAAAEAGAGRVQGAAGARTRSEAVETAHRLWANEQLPGELAQVLPTPRALRAGVAAGDAGHGRARSVVCGPDADRHVEQFRSTWTPATTRSTCSRSAPTRRASSGSGPRSWPRSCAELAACDSVSAGSSRVTTPRRGVPPCGAAVHVPGSLSGD